jgi:hypothetical protein
VDTPFTQPFQANCLRCGAAIDVTVELIQPKLGAQPVAVGANPKEAITTAPAEPTAKAPGQSNGANKDHADTQAKSRIKKAPVPPSSSKSGAKAANVFAEDEARRNRPSWPSKAKPPEEKPPRRRGPIIAAVVVVVLLAGGGGAYWFLANKKPASNAAAKASPKPAAKQSTSKAAPASKKKEEPPPPPAKGPLPTDYALAAPRLSAELRGANLPVSNAKYAGKVLEVSGLFAKIESKEGLHPPPHPHAVFHVEGQAVLCDLQSGGSELALWKKLPPGQPITVRGRYEKDGYLRECFLMPLTSPADSTYKGKTLEVVGRVERTQLPDDKQLVNSTVEFPTVILEGETNGLTELRCLFRKEDADEVRKIQPGSLLTLQGECNGRHVEMNSPQFRQQKPSYYVRLDNCRLVYTSAPPAGTQRLGVIALLRPYEEDLRPYFLPPPRDEERIESLRRIRQLAQENAADARVMDTKYLHRLLVVAGKPRKSPNERSIILESGDTDVAFRVRCYFTPSALRALDGRKESEYQVRGLCSGLEDKQTLRLDNCELDMPAPVGPALTAEFLPYKPGRAFTVDVALHGDATLYGVAKANTNKKGAIVRRELHVQRKDGLTEVFMTHRGMLPAAKTLFDEGVQQAWIQQKGAKVTTPVTAALYFLRLKAGFVEVGVPVAGDRAKVDVNWFMPLKLEARPGDKWSQESPEGDREYVLEKLDRSTGHLRAYIRETLTLKQDIVYPIETLHVYEEGLGEVERRQWKQLNRGGDKKLQLEMKWVGVSDPGRDK